MRLIDADNLMEQLSKCIYDTTDPAARRAAHDTMACCQSLVDNQPAAYDVDKVVEQLEQQKNQYFRRAEEIKNKFGENYESQKNYGKACSYDYALKIVKSGGIE